jgi:trk system potassium uptake protein TrkA
MAETKHFVVIGLGTFGAALASRLAKNGCRVTGVDNDRDRVEALKDLLYEAVIGDATNRHMIAQLPVQKANAVYISMGEDITRSLLATLHVKEERAGRIVVKGVTAEHGAILKSLGVERVVFPEIEIAETLADRATWPNVVDFLPIGVEYAFIEIAVPDSLAGKSLRDLRLRQRYDVSVVGVKNALDGKLNMFPDGQYVLGPDQMLLVVGKEKELALFQNID